MHNPLISIIVPIYNAEKTLLKCLDSILVQSYRNFELILIDDGSKDNSPNICNKYAAIDSRVIVIHKENGGVSSARNAGLDISKGKWITFIDSDDYITDCYLMDVENSHEDVIFKKYQWLREDGLFPGTNIKEKSSFNDFLSSYITDSLIRGPVFKFYRKDLLGDIRFLTDMKIGEDVQFVFRYLAKCKTYRLLSRGEYIVRTAEVPDEVNYAISVEYAVNSLLHLYDAYEELLQTHPLGKKPFVSYIAYFKRISKSNWKKRPSLWYNNKKIHFLYQYVWKDLSMIQQIKYKLIQVI